MNLVIVEDYFTYRVPYTWTEQNRTRIEQKSNIIEQNRTEQNRTDHTFYWFVNQYIVV